MGWAWPPRQRIARSVSAAANVAEEPIAISVDPAAAAATTSAATTSTAVETGAEHSSTGPHRHITHIEVIREFVIGVEGRGLSTRNAGQLSPLLLTSQLFREQILRTASISRPLQYRTCNLDHRRRASRPLYDISRYICLHHHRAHHNHHLS